MSSSSGTGGFARYKSAILACLAALLIAVFLVRLFQYFDRRLREPAQVTRDLGFPILASIAMSAGRDHSLPSVSEASNSLFADAFRMLRSNLALDSGQTKVILVTSPEAGEGKTTVASNLARILALQHSKVLLIDGNLRQPDIAGAFGIDGHAGLLEALSNGARPQDHVVASSGVDILAAAVKPDSLDLLSPLKIKALLDEARQRYDAIIVDSAGVSSNAETRILAKACEATIVVLRPNYSQLDLAKDSFKALEIAGTRVLGVVINGTRARVGG